MDVLKELSWAEWGPMRVREVESDDGPIKVVTPAGKTRRIYDVFQRKGSLLDELVEAADSAECRDVLLRALAAGDESGKAAFRLADQIRERDICAFASRWGFLTMGEPPEPKTRAAEPLSLWMQELLKLRQASDLLMTGGKLSGTILALYAHTLVDQPAVERSPSEGRLDARGFWWKPGPAERALERTGRAEGARELLELALTRQLSRGDIEVVAKGGRYALRPTTLIAAAWLELGDRVLRAPPEKTCPKCNLPFVPPTRRRVFCSEKCKDDAKNMRRSAKGRK
jgi:hypothetical protein